MVKTEIINSTGWQVELSMGNAGVYVSVREIPDKQRHVLEIDPNATYREYVIVVSRSGEKVFITSDDCIDNKKLELVLEKEAGVFKFKPTARQWGGSATKEVSNMGYFKRLFKKLFKGDSSLS